MLFLIFSAIGAAVGIPIGALLNHSLKKPEEDSCTTTSSTWNNERCVATSSKSCIDGLCSKHCKEIHGSRCLDKFL